MMEYIHNGRHPLNKIFYYSSGSELLRKKKTRRSSEEFLLSFILRNFQEWIIFVPFNTNAMNEEVEFLENFISIEGWKQQNVCLSILEFRKKTKI